jgi:hypothetical protein
MTPIYQSNGIIIFESEIANIKFLQYGDPSWPAIIYLHGKDEVGKTPKELLTQSPVCAGWNPTLPPWGNYEGWKYPDFFKKNIQVIAPILPSGSWTNGFINTFLDALNLQVSKGLIGWSLGAAGVGNYLNQSAPKHKVDFGILCSMANVGSGANVKTPIKMIHSVGDTKQGTPVSNSDTFWAGIPSQYKSEYQRPLGDNHYAWSSLLEPSTGIYEWIKSFSVIAPPVTYTLGIVELGSNGVVYGNFNGNRIQLSLPK